MKPLDWLPLKGDKEKVKKKKDFFFGPKTRTRALLDSKSIQHTTVPHIHICPSGPSCSKAG